MFFIMIDTWFSLIRSQHMSTSPITSTRLTESRTPTHEDFDNAHSTRSKKPTEKREVTFSLESEFRTASPDSLLKEHRFTIETGSPFEQSPKIRELFSPSTLEKIEGERQRQVGKGRVKVEEQSSPWFPVFAVAFLSFLICGVYMGGEASSKREG